MKACFILALAMVAFAEIPEEDDVLVLDDTNIDEALDLYPEILIEFYAPWCGHCKTLAPEYAKAAARLKKNDPPVRIAKCDATIATSSASKFGVQGFPTLKYFINKNPSEYGGGRTEDTIVSWILKKIGQGLQTLADAEAAKEFLQKNQIAVLLNADKDSAEAKNFEAVVKGQDGFLYALIGDEAIGTEQNIKKPGLAIIKQIDDKRVDFTGDLTSHEEVNKWISENQTPWVMPFDDAAIEIIFRQSNPAIFLFRKDGDATHAIFEEAAPDVKSDIVMSFADISKPDQQRLADYLGVNEKDMPCLFVVEPSDAGVKKFRAEGGVTVENVKKVVADWKAGSLSPEYKSEEVPAESHEGNVRVLVGKNFDEVVYDKTKDVLVEFYAPWCGHCKKLAPEYEDAATQLKDTMPDAVLAKIDSTGNEVPAHPVQGFPTLKWFPTDNKDGVEYNGGRDAAGLLEWFKTKGTTKTVEAAGDAEGEAQKEEL